MPVSNTNCHAVLQSSLLCLCIRLWCIVWWGGGWVEQMETVQVGESSFCSLWNQGGDEHLRPARTPAVTVFQGDKRTYPTQINSVAPRFTVSVHEFWNAYGLILRAKKILCCIQWKIYFVMMAWALPGWIAWVCSCGASVNVCVCVCRIC